MRKATHTGHCQICGSMQKLPGDVLSIHGYTVKWGFFSGTCNGTHGKPFEVSTDLIEAAIVRATGLREAAIARAAELRAMTSTEGYVHEYVRNSANMKGGSRYEWRTVEISMQPYDHAPTIARAVYVIDGQQKDANVPHAHSQTAESVAAYLRNTYAHAMFDTRAASLQEYIEWQTARVKNWQPAECKPIAPEVARVTVGTTVRVNGREGIVTDIRDQRGNYNGPTMPHAIVTRADGKTFAVPVRNIRTILKPAP